MDETSYKINPPLHRIGVVGASGFIGKELCLLLSQDSNKHVIGLSRTRPSWWPENATHRKTDFFSLLQVEHALKDVDTLVYLLHSMLPTSRLSQGGFRDFDLILADNTARVAQQKNIKHMIYLSGLMPQTTEELSPHLKSRLEVERTFLSYSIPTTILRAGLVIGPEGSSFQILTRLVHRLPIMICPRWTQSPTVPTSLFQITSSIQHCLSHPPDHSITYDIGFRQKTTYLNLIIRLSKQLGKKRLFLRIPFVSPSLSKLWIMAITGAPKRLVGPLISSLKHTLVVRDSHRLTECADTLEKTFERLSSSPICPKTPTAYIKRRSKVPRVRSIQCLKNPHLHDVDAVSEYYFVWLQKVLSPLITTNKSSQTITISFLSKYPLLVLEESTERSVDQRVLYYISEGLLFKKNPVRGRFEFRQSRITDEIMVALHEFQPALPWYLYRWTQAIAHAICMRLFEKELKRNKTIKNKKTQSTPISSFQRVG